MFIFAYNTTLFRVFSTLLFSATLIACGGSGSSKAKSIEKKDPPTISTDSIIPYRLNDTGITTCSTAEHGFKQLNCAEVNAGEKNDGFDPISGQVVPAGQDAHFGRDTLAEQGLLIKAGQGPAGFDYTKLDANGDPLSIQSGSWSADGSEQAGTKWSCVVDNVTGLFWEVKTSSDGLHSVNNTYSWYNTDSSTNGGFEGYPNSGNCSGSACDTQAFVSAVKDEGLCGFSDWRMPNTEEMLSIINKGRINPATNDELGPVKSNYYWTDSPYFLNYDLARYIDFNEGGKNYSDRLSRYYIRLVRGGRVVAY